MGRLRAPTAEQAAVIRLEGGPARVLAGAGSGKTHTMAELVSYRVDEYLRRLGGTAPERILALTFTVKAADEMRSRLLGRIGEQALKLTVANFHSYALEIVRENAAVLGLEPDAPVLRGGRAWLMILDELAARDLVLRRLDLSGPAGAANKVLTLLSQAKNDLVELGSLRLRTERDLANANSDGLARVFEERLDLVELAERFEARRKARGLLRYEDMIELAARVLADPLMGEGYRGRYDFIVVDEFQDTNPAQLRFVELLAGDLSKVVVIGDDLQSIYNFTGASIRNIQRFEEEAGVPVGSRTFPLAINFRSGERILSLANHIAEAVHPEGSPDEPKILRPREAAPQGEIGAFVRVSDAEEGREIARRVQALVREGAEPSACAVLIRRWSQAVPILAALTEIGIPCEVVEGGDLLSRPEIRFVSDHLRLVASPGGAKEALLRLLSRAPSLLDPDDLRAAFTAPGGPEAALRDPDSVTGISSAARKRLAHLSGVFARLELEMAEADSLGDLVERVVEATGLGHELRSSPEAEASLALQFLGIYRDVAAEFGDVRFIGEFIRYLEISADSRSAESAAPPSGDSDAVRVTTIHKAKGLEFDHVFVPGLSAKLFPDERAPESALATAHALPPSLELDPEPDAAAAYDAMDAAALKESLARGAREEEGRLFYVACTRARDTLTLSRAHYYRDLKGPKPPGAFWDLIRGAPEACAISFAPEPEVPASNPNVEEGGTEKAPPDPWPLAATAEGDDAGIAAELGVEGWEEELSGLRRDIANIPKTPQPKHVLPPPQKYSPSSLMELEICARRYYYTRVFPVPFGSEGLEESQEYGSAVHAWIEDGMQGEPPKPGGAGWGPGDHAPATAGGFGASEYAVRASSYPPYEGGEPPETGPARMVEVPFALEVGGAEVRGRIDAVFLDEDGTVHLVDWKTGRPHEGYKDRLQLPLYALAANRLWGVEPEKMRLAYVFVPSGATVEVETGEGLLDRTEERVLGAREKIRAREYEPSPSRLACSYCPVIGVGIEGCPTGVPEE